MIYRETHTLLEEITEASVDVTRKEHMEQLATVALLIIDDLEMRKLAPTAAEELLEIAMLAVMYVPAHATYFQPPCGRLGQTAR